MMPSICSKAAANMSLASAIILLPWKTPIIRKRLDYSQIQGDIRVVTQLSADPDWHIHSNIPPSL